MSLFNRDLQREWYFSREFWEHDFEPLAKSPFNQFTLIFGHQTSHFALPFPFRVDVPGYERRVVGIPVSPEAAPWRPSVPPGLATIV